MQGKQKFFTIYRRKSGGGFTLIELLVVVAILALLASIILVSALSIRDKSKDVRIVSEINQLRNIAALLRKDYDSYQNLCSGSTLNEGAPAPYGEQFGAVENDINKKQGDALNINCQADVNSYCLDVNLITPGAGRYCIDDDGNTSTTAESFVCVSADTACK